MNLAWNHPFTCVIAGPTGCGKTVWVRQFLEHISTIMSPVPEEVVWCYGEWQAVYEQMKDVTFVEGLPQTQSWTDGKPRLIILDDLISYDEEILYFINFHHVRSSLSQFI